ncbi:hypothetical protein CHS0354_007814 [Potamilus streckersoni]|uniref:Disintegrin domain-containing protein n=1 Tax=Potamilus streckersoni TaxID=2493646 RepID=A0AAE0RR72_9BIVA|nr:hypothetical protein CHS0354_007814 [Potamilus streckersoni]
MGSEHDPETDECAPSERGGGKFVMYPWAVSGYEKNNKNFSPCSKEYIFQVARAKGESCFSEKTDVIAFCGNGRVDQGETCDEGWETSQGKGQCCDENCKLRPGAKCSPVNAQCCYKCQIASSTQECRLSLPLSCQGPVFCDGKNIKCPNVTKPLDGVPCIDDGICQNGECRNFCQQQNTSLVPCICPKESGSACHRCCRPASDEEGIECKSYNAKLPDGRPCFQGTCSNGICVKQVQDMVERLFDIIESITIDQVVAFMKSNIVGTVIVISLFLWIPASCVVSFIDRKREREEKQARLWKSKSNRALFLDEDRSRIRRIPNMRSSRHHGSVVRHFGHDNETVL